MPRIDNLTLVTTQNIHELIPAFISERSIIIASYEDMMEVVLDMVKSRHVFNMERDLLRSIMEDLTYMFCPGDDINKERVVMQLAPSDDEDDEEGDDIEDMPPQVKVDSLVASDIED